MTNLDDRAARAKEELDMVFTDTDVPPAAGIRRRHQRRRVAQATLAGVALIAVAVGLANGVNDESANGPEGVVTDAPSGSAQLENSRWTLESTIVDGAERRITGLPDDDKVLVTFSAIQDCSELAPTAGIEGSCSMFVVQGVCVSFATLVEVRESTLVSHEAGEVDPGCMDLGIGSLFESEVAYSSDGDSLTLTGADGFGVRLLRVPSATDDTTETTPSSSLDPIEIAFPATMVAALDDGRIVELADDGSVARDILTLVGEQEVGHLQLVGGNVYFTSTAADDYPQDGGCGRLSRVPLDGIGIEQLEYDTGEFSVSPDETRIAFTQLNACGSVSTPASVSIVDIASGEVHTWKAPEDGDDFFETGAQPRGMSWSPDGEQLAVAWCYEGCSTMIHDPDVDGTVYRDPSTEISGGSPAWTPGDLIWTLQTTYGDVPAEVDLSRYEPSTGTASSQESPFGVDDQTIHASGNALIALVGALDGTPSILRWEIDGTVSTLPATTQAIEAFAAG